MPWEQQSDEIEINLFFLPIIVNVVGNFIDSVGWCIQKKAHLQRLSNEDTKNESFVKSKKWWFGYVVHASGDVIAKISYAFGPASLLLPLDTLIIAWTTALASKYLGETVTIKEIIGIAIIILAAAISTMFGPKPQGGFYTIEDIQFNYEQTAFLIVAGVLSGFVGLNWFGLRFKFFEPYRTDEYCMLTYIQLASFFGSWNVMLVKCVLEVLSSSFISAEIAKMNWTHWLTYLNLVVMPATSVAIE